MTFYQQIQNAIDLIEQDLSRELDIESLASEAAMSVATFYRYFGAMTGFTCKQYVRRRRLTRALSELASSEKTITDIALNCGYQSHEAFTRAFSKEFGQTPMQYRSGNRLCRGIRALKLIEETVMGLTIKQLEAIPVARYRVISAAPEADAWSHLSKWAEQEGLFNKPYRCFGYNRPNPFEVDGHEMIDEGEYGYEVLLSFDESLQPRYPADGRGVREGLLKGGRYAVLGIGVNCEEQDIERGWARMTELLKASDYKTTGYWFEEHLEFNPEAGQLPSRMDLYVQLEDTQ